MPVYAIMRDSTQYWGSIAASSHTELAHIATTIDKAREFIRRDRLKVGDTADYKIIEVEPDAESLTTLFRVNGDDVWQDLNKPVEPNILFMPEKMIEEDSNRMAWKEMTGHEPEVGSTYMDAQNKLYEVLECAYWSNRIKIRITPAHLREDQ
jgi:hypothetical protein